MCTHVFFVFFFKQKTAYEMRISDWSSDVCSSDLTTITEKLLLMGKATAVAGTVKSRKSDRHATSDWMEMEKQRGISITTSVMQFPYREHMINQIGRASCRERVCQYV